MQYYNYRTGEVCENLSEVRRANKTMDWQGAFFYRLAWRPMLNIDLSFYNPEIHARAWGIKGVRNAVKDLKGMNMSRREIYSWLPAIVIY